VSVPLVISLERKNTNTYEAHDENLIQWTIQRP
jgi:hypothetical protein